MIEIASEGDPGVDAREKLPRYRQAKIPEIWLVDPFERTVIVERKADTTDVRSEIATGRLESTVVPGFWIEASWLWQEDLPSTLTCLRQILGNL